MRLTPWHSAEPWPTVAHEGRLALGRQLHQAGRSVALEEGGREFSLGR
jgi:hypothetical protein